MTDEDREELVRELWDVKERVLRLVGLLRSLPEGHVVTGMEADFRLLAHRAAVQLARETEGDRGRRDSPQGA